MTTKKMTLFLAGALVLTGCSGTVNQTSPPPTNSATPPAVTMPAVNAQAAIESSLARIMSGEYTVQYTDSSGKKISGTLPEDAPDTVQGVFNLYSWRAALPAEIPAALEDAFVFRNKPGESLSVFTGKQLVRIANKGVEEYYVYDLPVSGAWHALESELQAAIATHLPFLIHCALRELAGDATTMIYTNAGGVESQSETRRIGLEQTRALFDGYNWLPVPKYYEPTAEVWQLFIPDTNGSATNSPLSLSVCVGVQMVVVTQGGTSSQFLYFTRDEAPLQSLDVELRTIFDY